MAIREKAKKLDKILSTLERTYSRAVLSEGKNLLERFVFYWFFYASPVTNAKKAVKSLLDEEEFADWNEVRVSTQRELQEILEANRIEDASDLAPRLKTFLQSVFEELDDTDLESLKEMKPDKARRFLASLPGLPPWAVAYLVTLTGFEALLPWDPHTERVGGRIGLFDTGAPLPQRKKQLRAALQDEDPLRLHHLFVEHGKKTCTDVDPKCPKCPVSQDCAYYLRRGRRAKKAATNGTNGSSPTNNKKKR
ncbi:hypothetical protein HY251_20790 [bacterium]|nr:hypothetical protein [bacterium]